MTDPELRVLEQLLEACRSMLVTTGGSKYWNGETEQSLLLIEAAVAAAEMLLEMESVK